MVDTLHEIAAAEGPGSQGRKLDLLAGLLGQETPLEVRYLPRLVTGGLRLGIGTPTILDALAQVHASGRAARPELERAYNICCDLPAEILAKLGGQCAAEYKYDGVRIQAHKTPGARIELFIRRLARVSSQFPDIVDLLAAGLGPAEAIVEGEAVVFDVAAEELRRSARSWSGAASTASPRPCETCQWPCSASNCCTPTATT